jgi:ribonucleoside-diphosphate reductase alpha chain
VASSAGVATGPVGFLRVYDKAFGEVAQGGTRRGANMAVLRVDHPDIRHFITCKTDENQITNFNISVAATDAFMQAVRDDAAYDLVAPHSGQVVETVRAREIFDLMVQQAHHNGEPGILFIDAANRSNPVPHLYELEATNPCGEQWLGPTRTAAWARSTWPNTPPPGAGWIGRGCSRASRSAPASWTM